MANPYPANFTDDSGTVREAGAITFTDAGNQPGGSSPFELLGPFPFTYSMAGAINGANAPVMVTLEPGQIILKAFAIVVTSWSDAGSLNIVLGSSDQWAIATYAGPGGVTGRELLPYPGTAMHFLAAVSGTGVLPNDVAAVYYPDADPPTVGASDIYVFVTAPT